MQFSLLAFAQAVEGAAEADTSPVYSEILEFNSRIITVYGFKNEAELDARFYDVMKLSKYKKVDDIDLQKMKLIVTKENIPSVLQEFMEKNDFEYVTYFKYDSSWEWVTLVRKFRNSYYSISYCEGTYY